MDIYNNSVLCNICLEYFTKSIIHVHCDTNQCHDCTKREAITLYKNRGIGFSSKCNCGLPKSLLLYRKYLTSKQYRKLIHCHSDNHAVLNLDTPKEKKIATLILPNTTTSLTINTIESPSRKPNQMTPSTMLMNNIVECPKCKTKIQRNNGCYHLCHRKCPANNFKNVDFCANCGECLKRINCALLLDKYGNNHFPNGVYKICKRGNLNYCISCERPADSPTTPFKKKYSCYEGIVCDLCQYCYYCESFGHDCNIRCMSCNKKNVYFQKDLPDNIHVCVNCEWCSKCQKIGHSIYYHKKLPSISNMIKKIKLKTILKNI